MKKHKFSHRYRNAQKSNGKLFSFVLSSLLFFCPIAVQPDGIGEAPSHDPMSDEAIRYLQGEDIYQGTLSWQGNKAFTKLIRI